MDKQNSKAIKKGYEVIKNLEDLLEVEDIVQDNKIEFTIRDKVLRVRKSNTKEIKDINKFRRHKYLELVNDDTYLFRDQWIKTYKKKGIDIEEMVNQISDIQNDIKKLLLQLATTTDKPSIETLKTEISELREKQFKISYDKSSYLSYSIEDQLIYLVNSYTLYSVLEIKTEDSWKRLYESYEKFQESNDDEIINTACNYLNKIIYSADIFEEEK